MIAFYAHGADKAFGQIKTLVFDQIDSSISRQNVV